MLCGYQGWFRCPGDGTTDGWRHWSRSSQRIGADTLTFEMWPDVSEFGDGEKFVAPGFTLPGGRPAHLFSSAHPRTVERHFEWMRNYGIDGAFLQRFVVELDRKSLDVVLANVRAAAAKTGRTYAICYDLSGAKSDTLVATLAADWRRLVDELHISADERYLHHRGRPVVFVWGFFRDRFDAVAANQIIDIFHEPGPRQATLVGGCFWPWRKEQDAEWAKMLRRLDVISPWNVGNVTITSGQKDAAAASWSDDLAQTQRTGQEFLPVIYPGFGWVNLKGREAARDTIDRRGGEFYWRQWVTAARLKVDMAYVAMFDEVDEATAIFKVTNQPPTPDTFTTYGDLPSNWYLRLTGEGARLLRGERDENMPRVTTIKYDKP